MYDTENESGRFPPTKGYECHTNGVQFQLHIRITWGTLKLLMPKPLLERLIHLIHIESVCRNYSKVVQVILTHSQSLEP